MKREMELVRSILLALEEHPSGYAPGALEIDGFSTEQINYHAAIMNEAGLVIANPISNLDSSSPEAILVRLTWQGHEFLDASRNPSVWAQAKSIVTKAGGASFQIWLAVLTEVVKKSVGL